MSRGSMKIFSWMVTRLAYLRNGWARAARRIIADGSSIFTDSDFTKFDFLLFATSTSSIRAISAVKTLIQRPTSHDRLEVKKRFGHGKASPHATTYVILIDCDRSSS